MNAHPLDKDTLALEMPAPSRPLPKSIVARCDLPAGSVRAGGSDREEAGTGIPLRIGGYNRTRIAPLRLEPINPP